MIDIQSRIISERKPRLVYDGDPGWGICKHNGSPIRHVAVIELSPHLRTVRWMDRTFIGRIKLDCGCCYQDQYCGCCYQDQYKEKLLTFTLALPYLQFWTIQTDSQVVPYLSWRPKPLEVVDGKVQPVLLPNVYQNCRICMGAFSTKFAREDPTYLANLFWERKFTPREDDWPCSRFLKMAGLSSFEKWSQTPADVVMERLTEFFDKWACHPLREKISITKRDFHH